MAALAPKLCLGPKLPKENLAGKLKEDAGEVGTPRLTRGAETLLRRSHQSTSRAGSVPDGSDFPRLCR